jgi:hypothetical protein
MSCFDRVQFGGYVYGVFCAIKQSFLRANARDELMLLAIQEAKITASVSDVFELEIECR